MIDVLVLPGFNIKNKEWAQEVVEALKPLANNIQYFSWPHWQSDSVKSGWADTVAEEISKNLSQHTVIIAKSIGTLVAAKVAKMSPSNISKIILCGVPTNDLTTVDLKQYQSLSVFNSQNIICFQNNRDPHGSSQQIQQFFASINLNIQIVSKDRSDHDYPYFEDYLAFIQDRYTVIINTTIMQNKILFAVLAGVIFSGCLPSQGKIEINSNQSESKKIEQAAKLSSIISSGGNALCNISSKDDPKSSTTMYISGKKMKIVGTDTPDGKKGYILNDGEYTYIWAEGEKEGFKTKNTPTPATTDSDKDEAAMYTSEDYAGSYEDESKYTVSCDIGKAADSEFTPPSTVKFSDPLEMIKNK